MSEINNSTNSLSVRYRSLDRRGRRIFRRRLADLCKVYGEKTIYRKLRPDYEPSPIEELAAKMIVDELQN